MREKKSIGIGLIFLIVVLVSGQLMAIQVVDAKKDVEKLSPLILEQSSLDLPLFQDSQKIKKGNQPKFLRIYGENNLIGVSDSKKLAVVDLTGKKIVAVLDIPDVKNISFVSGCADYFVFHGNDIKISRYDSKSLEKRWTAPYPFTDHGGVKTKIGEFHFDFPIEMDRIPGSNTLLLKGVFLENPDSKDPVPTCRVLKMDMETGNTAEEKIYDYRRKLGNGLSLYMKAPMTEFDIIKESTGEVFLSGKCETSDLLFKKNQYYPVDLKGYANLFPFSWQWDFSGIVTDGGLIMYARRYINAMTKTGISDASWIFFDTEGNRLKKVVNMRPMVYYTIRNLKGGMFPMVIPNNKQKGKAMEIDHFWVIQKDGSMSKIPVPAIPVIKRLTAWQLVHLGTIMGNKHILGPETAHDGEMIYITLKDGLYGFTMGEKTAKKLASGDKKTFYRLFSGKEHAYAIRVSSKGEYSDTIIRLSDLEELSPSVFSEDLTSENWSDILDWRRPKVSLPLTVNNKPVLTYLQLNMTPGITKNIEGNNNKKTSGFRIWNHFDRGNKFGDLALYKVLLKSGTSALIGKSLLDNSEVFVVPTLHLSGFPKDKHPDGIQLPFVVRMIKDSGILVVFETVKRIKIYKIKRPEMNI